MNCQDVEGRGRGLFWGAITAFVWTDRGKSVNTQTLPVATKETYLEVTAEKIQYLFMSREQNAAQNHKERNSQQVPWKCGRVQTFGNDRTNESYIKE